MSSKLKELIDHRTADGHNLAYSILSALQAIAPTWTDQAKLADIYNEAWADGGNEQQLKIMLNLVQDGVNHGNWPWSKP